MQGNNRIIYLVVFTGFMIYLTLGCMRWMDEAFSKQKAAQVDPMAMTYVEKFDRK